MTAWLGAVQSIFNPKIIHLVPQDSSWWAEDGIIKTNKVVHGGGWRVRNMFEANFSVAHIGAEQQVHGGPWLNSPSAK
jgi:hypothetical protein